MAGFNFSLTVTERQLVFVRNLFRSVQKWGSGHQVQFRYRKESARSFICLVDGPLINIQFLEALIATCLPVMGVVNGDPLTNLERSRVIGKLIRKYNESLCHFHNFVIDMAVLIRGTPNSINFNYGLSSNLGEYLDGLSISFIAYLRGDVTPRQHAEECHTAIEILCIQFRKDGSWENKVDAAIEAGALSKNYKNDLVSLKDLRKRAKHRGQLFSDTDLKTIIQALVKATHELVISVGAEISKPEKEYGEVLVLGGVFNIYCYLLAKKPFANLKCFSNRLSKFLIGHLEITIINGPVPCLIKPEAGFEP